VISYRGRSAIREVGKAFGLSEDAIGACHRRSGAAAVAPVSKDAVTRTGLDPQSRRMRQILRWRAKSTAFPRHLPACRRLRHHAQPARRE
jgi:error-prone DNA polymerase